MERRGQISLAEALLLDIVRLHETWMEIVFPRQLDPSAVLGKWKPETAVQTAGYYLWAALGAPLVAVVYPLLLVGFATRYYASKLDSAVARFGVLGAVLVATLVWGSLTLVAHLQLPTDVMLGIGGASVVAVVSAGLAAGFSKVGGRFVSVLLAYPFAMTAIFLPPVVAALLTPSISGFVLDPSYALAVWILDTILAVGGINETLRAAFDLETFGDQWGVAGLGYVLMWVGISVPLGWFLGLLVALADLIRPKPDA
ncbi:hypothetical protein U4E84_07170 [Halorubrum sp. AD140]|uniref:hypothetical protein n=1 Tax=Halorubrum sp. AD140 TaxID=3050073 RepID=UPI002ACC9654|nr:hypothetical protein [Halorubrum sp. AD140]MDZ5811125.1 hypothetical protein [Halorubrum sp. AD140]